MKEITTYVGVDAHKKDLFIAMLVGDAKTPVTWTVPNEPKAIRRLVRKLERDDQAAPSQGLETIADQLETAARLLGVRWAKPGVLNGCEVDRSPD